MSISSIAFITSVASGASEVKTVRVMPPDGGGVPLWSEPLFEKDKRRKVDVISKGVDEAITRDLPRRVGAVSYLIVGMDAEERVCCSDSISAMGLAAPRDEVSPEKATKAIFDGSAELLRQSRLLVSEVGSFLASARSQSDHLFGHYSKFAGQQQTTMDRLCTSLIDAREQTSSLFDESLASKVRLVQALQSGEVETVSGTPGKPSEQDGGAMFERKLMAIGGMMMPIVEGAKEALGEYAKAKASAGSEKVSRESFPPAFATLRGALGELDKDDMRAALEAYSVADPDLAVLKGILSALGPAKSRTLYGALKGAWKELEECEGGTKSAGEKQS